MSTNVENYPSDGVRKESLEKGNTTDVLNKMIGEAIKGIRKYFNFGSLTKKALYH